MCWNRKRNTSHSVNYYSKILLIVLCLILIINVFVSFFTIYTTRQQNIDYITNTINLYLDDTLQKLNAMDHFMVWTVKNEPLITDIEQADGIADLSKGIKQFRSRVNDFQYTSGKEYQFFLLLKEENIFFNSSTLQINYTDYLEMKDYFMRNINGLYRYENIKSWYPLIINGKYFLYHLLEYENRVFISIISVDDLLLPLQDIELGSDGNMWIEYSKLGFLPNSNQELGIPQKHSYSFLTSSLVFRDVDTSLPFTLHLTVDHFSAFKKGVITQLALIAAIIIISIMLFTILRYVRNKLITPIEVFSKNLSIINQNNESMDFESSNIIELEKSNKQFKDLISKVKTLKINIYEQEIEKKQTQLDYMQLQIKPHFYLNCLTTIYSMAQMEMYHEIKEMTLSTSRYFRYLLQTKHDLVNLEDELKHVQDYLSIQKLVHHDALHYHIEMDAGIEQSKIPPLVLQTFIENTVKYSVSPEEQIKIKIEIHYVDNKQAIQIKLKDNGPGFPEAILTKLKQNIPLTTGDGKQIGIHNVIQRLQLLYGKDFSIDFSNNLYGGTVIQIILPQKENML